MDRMEICIGLGRGDWWVIINHDRAARLGAAMTAAWFFIAIFYSSGITQAGPFVSLDQCEAARKVWVESNSILFDTPRSSPCYQGVIK